jgi:hypothetical protein
MLSVAKPIPPVLYNGFDELPLFARSSSFESGLQLSQPTRGNTDPWPWLPSTMAGAGCEWCRDEGRHDSNSLKIDKTSSDAAEWLYQWEGDGGFTETWSKGKRFRVSVWVKTKDVVGRGASLAVRWGVYNHAERFPYLSSQRVVGTVGEWTKLEIEIEGPPPEPSAHTPGSGTQIQIILRQDGSGTTWFDDILVEVLSSVSATQDVSVEQQLETEVAVLAQDI